MMKMTIGFLAAMLVGPAFAQPTSILEVMGPNPVLAGVKVSCGTAITVVATIDDVAYATPQQIALRPDFFTLPGSLQLFIYAHECAHQIYGSDEAAADCWAVRTGKSQGWLGIPQLQEVQMYSFPSPGDWTHMPGPVRAEWMSACYHSA